MLVDGLQALAAGLGQGLREDQDAGRLVRAAADPPAQLVQLGEAEALGVLDDHQAGVGHVHAHLDHRGGHQHLELAAHEGLHHRRLDVVLEPPVHQAHRQVGQRGGEHLVGFLGGLQLQRLGLLDQRAHPVGLAALDAGVVDAADHLLAARLGHQLGDDGRAARRQLVEHRHVEVGVVAHRQRAWDRRGRHHQHVRRLAGLALFAQGQALAHAEAVLLVDHRQGQAGQRHRVFDQRVGAHRQQYLAGGEARQGGLALLLLAAAGQPGHLQPERREPVGELAEVLLGEDLGGRHQHRLAAVLGGLQHGQRGHAGLARAHVALQQALHRVVGGEVAGDLGKGAGLGAGKGEGQLAEQIARQRVPQRQPRRVLGAAGGVGAAQGDLLGEQLVELDALPGRVAAVFDVAERHRRRRRVEQVQRLGQRGQVEVAAQGLGQLVAHAVVAHRAGNELAQRRLGEAGGGRVNRREALGQRLAGRHRLEARVDHLGAEEAVAQLAKDAQPAAGGQLLLLLRVEMHETQHHLAAGVPRPGHQLAARRRRDLAGEHLDLALGRHAGAHVGQHGEAGLVLVAQRQVEDQVGRREDVDLGQPLGELRPHPGPAAVGRLF